MVHLSTQKRDIVDSSSQSWWYDFGVEKVFRFYSLGSFIMKFLTVLTICLLTTASQAEELRVLAWNVESDGNDPNVIVRQLHNLPGYDIVGLAEVKAGSIKKYVDACRPVATPS